jgi:hypothetical protein
MKIRSQLEVSRRQLLQMGMVTTAATLVPTGVESPPESLAQVRIHFPRNELLSHDSVRESYHV